MGVDNFEICLKNGGVYQAGQVIEGVIKLKISDEPFKISKGLKINVDGSGYYRVQSVTSRDTRRYGLEEYITETLYLLNEGDQEIPVGDQEFPFAYQLPLNLPSSLETTSSLGIPLNLPSSLKTISFVGIETVIRYSITATMPRTLLKDLKHEIQFSVIGKMIGFIQFHLPPPNLKSRKRALVGPLFRTSAMPNDRIFLGDSEIKEG